mmetsp:Transcript_36310/g.96511  ORF Transcript_36310/g.96511 Transcript_36310/m.96511 type:complete len:99 (+) Transcript_36310:879-1175(+)
MSCPASRAKGGQGESRRRTHGGVDAPALRTTVDGHNDKSAVLHEDAAVEAVPGSRSAKSSCIFAESTLRTTLGNVSPGHPGNLAWYLHNNTSRMGGST